MVITFCKSKCCPTVEVVEDKIHLGDANGPEGVTVWTKENMKDFVEAAKDGKFDKLVAEEVYCFCGKQKQADCDIYCFDHDALKKSYQ